MASPLFDVAAEQLEHHSSLDRLQARGTLRLALKQAGLDPRAVTPGQLRVLCEEMLPGELEARGVADATSVCQQVMRDIDNSPEAREGATSPSLDDVFRRLGSA